MRNRWHTTDREAGLPTYKFGVSLTKIEPGMSLHFLQIDTVVTATHDQYRLIAIDIPENQRICYLTYPATECLGSELRGTHCCRQQADFELNIELVQALCYAFICRFQIFDINADRVESVADTQGWTNVESALFNYDQPATFGPVLSD